MGLPPQARLFAACAALKNLSKNFFGFFKKTSAYAPVFLLSVKAGKREYREAFRIQEYLHLETYDKQVMAALITSAEVIGEDRLEVKWKYGDIYEKILSEIQ